MDQESDVLRPGLGRCDRLAAPDGVPEDLGMVHGGGAGAPGEEGGVRWAVKDGVGSLGGSREGEEKLQVAGGRELDGKRRTAHLGRAAGAPVVGRAYRRNCMEVYIAHSKCDAELQYGVDGSDSSALADDLQRSHNHHQKHMRAKHILSRKAGRDIPRVRLFLRIP